MAKRVSRDAAVVGVADHAGWAILMTVAADRTLIDRRRVALVGDGLPWLPHHSQGQRLPLDEAVALVERVRRSAQAHAKDCLEALAATVSTSIAGIAMRTCPQLPETVAERISNYWAQTRADGVMYRDALAEAAAARGWFVHGYDTKRVFADAASALGLESIDGLLQKTAAAVGRPWRQDHRVAMAAAIAASARRP